MHLVRVLHSLCAYLAFHRFHEWMDFFSLCFFGWNIDLKVWCSCGCFDHRNAFVIYAGRAKQASFNAGENVLENLMDWWIGIMSWWAQEQRHKCRNSQEQYQYQPFYCSRDKQKRAAQSTLTSQRQWDGWKQTHAKAIARTLRTQSEETEVMKRTKLQSELEAFYVCRLPACLPEDHWHMPRSMLWWLSFWLLPRLTSISLRRYYISTRYLLTKLLRRDSTFSSSLFFLSLLFYCFERFVPTGNAANRKCQTSAVAEHTSWAPAFNLPRSCRPTCFFAFVL